ncbi:hypothetical protein [Candidatus Ulvibacter alkanivorans]|uniref:hypothetical protein n=1 Tax=Candidatus Ulvibacter alkanivorans TaxID=2267620 RepID=UPI000DF47656|nr:hypothetical protein [Candidatus Ulvibacter alkanivorans]
MFKIQLTIIGLLLFAATVTAHPGIGIVANSHGTVYYTDLNHVWKITPNGEVSIAVENVHTHELYIDADDTLYGEHEWYEGGASDRWYNYVWCLPINGKLEVSIPTVEGFLSNTTLVRDATGASYFSEEQNGHDILMKEDSDGKQLVLSDHKFEDIRWMYFSEDDKNIYVIDRLQLKKISPTGLVSTVDANLKQKGAVFQSVGDHHYAYGIWTDRDQQLYVALFGARKVIKIDTAGNKSTVYTAQDGWSVSGGMFTPDGTLWVLEYAANNEARVSRTTPNGNRHYFKD